MISSRSTIPQAMRSAITYFACLDSTFMMSRTDEDFELELRSLEGVLNVGITHNDAGDIEAVTLIVDSKDPSATHKVASQISSLYYPEAKIVVDGTSHLLSLQRETGS